MRFFERHRKDAEDTSPSGVFWTWWTLEGSGLATSALDGDGDVAALLTPQVGALGPTLDWEVGPGEVSRRRLVVTAAGDPAARATARRWLLAAPPPDRDWEYGDSRPPAANPRELVLTHEGLRADVASAVATAHVRGGAVDVSVHHPLFMDVDEGTAATVAALLLDAVLGEAAVQLWVGQVEVSAEPPLDPVPLTGLRAVVEELRRGATAADGSAAWVALTGTTPEGQRVVAQARPPLRAAVAPQLDTHVGVFLAFADVTPEGLPGPAAEVELRGLQRELAGLGERGEVVAHQTSGGVRVLHVYVDSTTDGERFVRAAAARWRGGRSEVQSQLDPGWAAVGHLRG